MKNCSPSAKQVANHAYGFISRGNRASGLRHIQLHLDDEDRDDAYAWFFNEMLTWDNSDAALFFAQDYLHRLLETGQSGTALKLITRCLHVDDRFRPHAADRAVVRELAEQFGRDDIAKIL